MSIVQHHCQISLQIIQKQNRDFPVKFACVARRKFCTDSRMSNKLAKLEVGGSHITPVSWLRWEGGGLEA